MKRRWILAGIAALAALAVCLILFYFAPVRTRAEGELVLWYAGTECSAESMKALAARCAALTLPVSANARNRRSWRKVIFIDFYL